MQALTRSASQRTLARQERGVVVSRALMLAALI
jgi:hypothetical protein